MANSEILEEEYAIGLDLGTTFSCIGVFRNGGVEIIPNKHGEKTTPSVVIINDSDILVGEETTEYLVKYYDSCIYEIKRLIGRKFSDKELQKEIKKLPFTIISANKGDIPEVEMKLKGKKVTYNPVQISSFIIKKMVSNAEKYLNKKVTKLVITVPAYFNDAQRNLTKQAAELLGLKVIRIINEPTAAALSYGFDKKENINEKILIFDLGGGTFDISILSLNKDEKNNNRLSFQVLGVSGDTQLGGEDFDNELVNYFLNKTNNEEEIQKDKRAMKRLKVACENIKKILSSSESTTLRINNFFKDQDLNEPITREEFENICQNLFNRLTTVMDEALKNAKLNKKDINEIILVGGSTRIPKVKKVVQEYFPGLKINDSINPDEAVAYGATLDAEKISHNKNELISNFHLLDITPLSLGTNVKNNSEDINIQKEGDEMSIIIQRGTHLPIEKSQIYSSAVDNQASMSIDIYEGEKRYVKYNHLLKKSTIQGLTKRPKGKTKVEVTFKINIDGILYVEAKELSEDNKGQTLNLKIKNDEINLTPEQIKELQEKSQPILDKMRENELTEIKDITNLKDSLNKYQKAFEKSLKEQKEKKKDDDEDDDEDDSLIYKNNFNNALEEFINSFDKNFDNETVLEKFYLYTRELFLSYLETLKLNISKGDQLELVEKMKKYIKIFIDKSTGYLNNLLDVLSSMTKKKKFKINFYNIIIFVMEELNKLGKDCIRSNKPFCKYHSLIYFEQSKAYYDKYLSNIDESLLDKNSMKSRSDQKKMCDDYIRDINSGAVVLFDESFRGGYLISEEIISAGRGITNDLRNFAIGNIQNSIERCKIVLANYENALASIQTENTRSKKEAICIANILKLNAILGYLRKKWRILLPLARRCELIIEHERIDKNEEWCKEFFKINTEIKKYQTPDYDYQTRFERIRKNHQRIFDSINDNFNSNGGNIKFINFILENHPFPNYQDEIKKGRNFKVHNNELIRFLLEQYNPDNYSTMEGDEESELRHCIAHEIATKLSNILTTF